MQTNIKDGYVKHETKGNITTIEFFHPLGNSLPYRILEELAHTIHAAGIDDSTRVIVVRSAGDKGFCAGAYFEELLTIETEQQGQRFFSGFADVINAIRKCPKMVIGRIQGRCVGGGVGLAAAFDYAIATEAADVKLSELAIGIGPFVIGPVVERKIGLGAFGHLAIDATMWRNAEWAKRKGLYAEVHASADGMDESIHRLSNALAHHSTEATRQLKKVLWEGTSHWDELLKSRAAISGKLVTSKVTKEALVSVKEKVIKQQQQLA